MLATKVSASLAFIYGLVHSVVRHANIASGLTEPLKIIVLFASLFPKPVHSPVLSTCTVMPATSYSKHRQCIICPKINKDMFMKKLFIHHMHTTNCIISGT